MTDDALRYPVGRFAFPRVLTAQERTAAIEVLATFPAHLRAAVRGLSESRLDTPYRDGGWTVRQVVHHVPESHMHAYCRLKYALTEENPTIKPYDERAWSGMSDQTITPVEASLQIIDGVHARFVILWRMLTPAQFLRTLQHPENGPMSLDDHLAMYAWHSRHHLGHILSLKQREGW